MKNRARNPKLKTNGVRNVLRLDPTRTTMLRKAAIADVRRRFARLALAIDELIVRQDSFGLRERRPFDPLKMNAFCPTGEGGGVDPSCGASGGGDVSVGKLSKESNIHYQAEFEHQGQKNTVNIFNVPDDLHGGRTWGLVFGIGDKDTVMLEMSRQNKYGSGAIAVFRKVGKVVDEFISRELPERFHFAAEKIVPSRVKLYDKLAKFLSDRHGYSLEHQDSNIERVYWFNKSKAVANQLRENIDTALLRYFPPTTNERWELKSSPEQLKKFQEWLAKQLKWTVVGSTPDQLWAKYVQEGFVKGAGRAFDDVKSRRGKSFRSDDFLQGKKRQFMSTSFRRPETVEKMKILASRTFEELTNVGEEIKLKLGRTLTDGLAQGRNPRDIARTMRDQLAIPMRRAETIARTEIIRAHAEGQLSAMEDLGVVEVGVMVEWSTAGDDRVCEACLPMEGVVLKLEEATGMIPRHPNCLPGHVRVTSTTGIAATSERFYDGDLIVIRTASNLVLSCTPNHPILTNDGRWTPAHLLNVGDHVVRYLGGQRECAIDDQNEHMPPCIEQVADSFRRSRKVTSAEVPTTAPDFHGDGAGSDVAIIRTYRELGYERNLSGGESFAQNHLVRGHVGRGVLSRLRSNALLLVGLLSTACRSIRSGYLRASGVLGHLRPLQRLGLALVPNRNPGLYQSTADYTSTDPERHSDSVFGRAGSVSVDQRAVVEKSVPTGLVFVAENADDDLVRDSELARQLASGNAGPVAFDQVVSMSVEKFVGHVYNLETGGGWYVANGIITHNCRCSFIPANVGESRKEQVRGKAKIERAIDLSARLAGDTFDVGIEIDVYRPRSTITPTKNAFCPTGEGGGIDNSCDGTPGESFKNTRSLTDHIHTDYSVQVDLTERPKYVAIEHIEAATPGTGEGTRVLKKVIAYAKSKGKDVRLTAHLLSEIPNRKEHAKATERLIKYYERLGFERASDNPTEQEGVPMRLRHRTDNAFCPTGPGGGVDPTCSPASQGFSTPAYHGSKLANFDMRYHMAGRGGYRYWTASEDHARRYAGSKGTLIKGDLKIEKPLDLMKESGPDDITADKAASILKSRGVDVTDIEFPDKAPMWRHVQMDGLKYRLRDAGYDAIVLSEKGGDKSYFIMEDDQIYRDKGKK